MRPFFAVVLCASLAVPGIAQAQSHKITGASLAGLCAASLEFVAGARNAAGAAEPQHLQVIQTTRDLYLGIPNFQPGEVEGYAVAWSQRMSDDLANAADDKARGVVATNIGSVARDCQRKMIEQYQAAQQGGQIPAAPQPAPTQPLTVQPLETQPLIINPQ